jgi:hypothetical protein
MMSCWVARVIATCGQQRLPDLIERLVVRRTGV